MTEVRGKDVAVGSEVNILSDDLSFSPFALTNACSFISVDAVNDCRVVFLFLWCHDWSTEITLWDHISGIVADTCCSTGFDILSEAHFPGSSWDCFDISFDSRNCWNSWMTEWL